MKRWELSVRAKASRPKPGVKVPFAAPSWAVDEVSAASCLSVLPETGGNWLLEGCSAAASSLTAGAGFVLVVPAAGVVELCLDEPPHAASASAAAPIASRLGTTG